MNHFAADQSTASHYIFDEAFLRKLERLALLSRQAMSGQMQGERRSVKRGHSVEFTDYRPYASGDDFRRIDWNAYARLERFFIKLFVEEEDLTVHLLIDNSPSMDWGQPNKLTYAIQAAAAMGYVALAGLDRVTISAMGAPNFHQNKRDGLPPIRGKNQAFKLFSYLKSIPPMDRFPSGRALELWLNRYASQVKPVGPLVIYSDLMDDGWQSGINHLAARGFEVSVLHILSPEEIEPSLVGDYRLIDCENTNSVEITADIETINKYRRHLAAWRDTWRGFCAARSIYYLPISTKLELNTLLFAHLRQGGVLR